MFSLFSLFPSNLKTGNRPLDLKESRKKRRERGCLHATMVQGWLGRDATTKVPARRHIDSQRGFEEGGGAQGILCFEIFFFFFFFLFSFFFGLRFDVNDAGWLVFCVYIFGLAVTKMDSIFFFPVNLLVLCLDCTVVKGWIYGWWM